MKDRQYILTFWKSVTNRVPESTSVTKRIILVKFPNASQYQFLYLWNEENNDSYFIECNKKIASKYMSSAWNNAWYIETLEKC